MRAYQNLPMERQSPKSYINVNPVEIFISSLFKRFALVTFEHGGKGAKSWRELTAINPGTITTDLEKMLVITKFPASYSAVEFLGSQVCFFITGVCSITRTHQEQHRIHVMNQPNNIISGHCRKEPNGRKIRQQVIQNENNQGIVTMRRTHWSLGSSRR
jgi:hypothetical protein